MDQIQPTVEGYVKGSLRATYRRKGSFWEGVVKDGSGSVVALCGHTHHNREQSTATHGRSAVACANLLISNLYGIERPQGVWA